MGNQIKRDGFLRATQKGKDGVIKCDSKSGGRGWLTKPKKLACKRK